MSCVSSNPWGPRRPRSAFSLLELLVAMLVTMLFLGGVYTTFVQISKGHQASEARMEALRSGRAALATIGEELKAVNTRGNKTQYHFLGVHFSFISGDGNDNDRDGLVDEEEVDGVIDSPTTSTNALDSDRHALLADGLQERPNWVGSADQGDAEVDVDAVFGRDVLTFRVYPTGGASGVDYKQITYEVKDFDNQSNVLVRRVEIYPSDGSMGQVAEAPLAFNVAGFDLLYWNPDPTLPQLLLGWNTDWDSDIFNSIPGVNFMLPASVYIRLTLNADPRPAETVQAARAENPDAPMDVITLETTVNIEEIIGDSQYPRA